MFELVSSFASERNLHAVNSRNRTTWRLIAAEFEISQFHLLRRDGFNFVCPNPKCQGRVQPRLSTHSKPTSCGQGSEVTVYEMAASVVTMGLVEKVPRNEGS